MFEIQTSVNEEYNVGDIKERRLKVKPTFVKEGAH